MALQLQCVEKHCSCCRAASLVRLAVGLLVGCCVQYYCARSICKQRGLRSNACIAVAPLCYFAAMWHAMPSWLTRDVSRCAPLTACWFDFFSCTITCSSKVGLSQGSSRDHLLSTSHIRHGQASNCSSTGHPHYCHHCQGHHSVPPRYCRCNSCHNLHPPTPCLGYGPLLTMLLSLSISCQATRLPVKAVIRPRAATRHRLAIKPSMVVLTRLLHPAQA